MYRVAIITSSDAGYRKEREDASGPVIREIVEQNGYQAVSYVVLPDEQQMLEEEMKKIADEDLADLIVTTGGTGFSPRDCMPEATMAVGADGSRDPGGHAGLQPAFYQTLHVKPRCGWNSKEDADRQSSRQSKGSAGMFGVYYHGIGSWPWNLKRN